MASTSRSFETVVSNEPSVSSYLLGLGNSGSMYSSTNSEVSQRSITPAECIIRQEWYNTLYATLLEYRENICELFTGSWWPFLGGKLEAILRCLCLPCVVFTRTLNGRRRYFNPQTGIMYLYVYLCVTVVLNLIPALHVGKINISTAEDIPSYFVIISMFVALALMLYLLLVVYKTVEFPHSRGKLLRIFYGGGVCVFGFTSFGYSVSVVIQYISCRQALDAVVTGVKALFILVQILFLHFFYEARIPEDSPYIDIIMAHLLGTNLGLWFWTLCSEAGSEIPKCISIDSLDKYFLPLFVEYSLLAASLLYQIWEHSSTRDPSMSLLQRYITQQSDLPENASRRDSLSENGNTSSTSDITVRLRLHGLISGLGFIIGGFFAALFVVLVVFAHFDTGSSDQGYHIAYSVGTLTLYLTEVCACYICQLFLQPHQRNPERFSPDHEDILLYFSLVGIVLWEVFHAYSLLLSACLNRGSRALDLGGDILGIAQHLFQTTTLVKLRRHQRMQGQCSVWICACLLFLVTTNLIFWVQDSFFIEVAITTPGEESVKLEQDLGTVIGHIVHPLTIFYRFHSSVCCVLAWSIFRN